MAQDKYRKQRPIDSRRAETDVASVDTQSEFTAFAERNSGPIAHHLFDQDLIEYDDRGELAVKKEKVKEAAEQQIREIRAAVDAREQIVQYEKEAAANAGQILTTKSAEARINRREAARAQAILLAAKIGKVKLTEAQERRLNIVAQGQYLDHVYSQYKSGDRGTALGVKHERGIGNMYRTEADREEQQRHFMQNVMSGRRKQRKATVKQPATTAA